MSKEFRLCYENCDEFNTIKRNFMAKKFVCMLYGMLILLKSFNFLLYTRQKGARWYMYGTY